MSQRARKFRRRWVAVPVAVALLAGFAAGAGAVAFAGQGGKPPTSTDLVGRPVAVVVHQLPALTPPLPPVTWDDSQPTVLPGSSVPVTVKPGSSAFLTIQAELAPSGIGAQVGILCTGLDLSDPSAGFVEASLVLHSPSGAAVSLTGITTLISPVLAAGTYTLGYQASCPPGQTGNPQAEYFVGAGTLLVDVVRTGPPVRSWG